jgi:peptide/nickel transport system ATP-binding protein
MGPVLEVDDLQVEYRRNGRWLPAVSGVSFTVEPGEVLGIVGESGCGKTTLARALVRLLPDNGRVSQGRVLFHGVDVIGMTDPELAKVRWAKVSMVFQGALNVLDPVYTVGFQLVEAIRKHQPQTTKSAARDRAGDLLEMVGIGRDRLRSYPHELSGGMRQRACIAMAMSLSPDLVIADEPTTALDVISQDNVLDRLLALQRESGMSLIIVSHDMGLIAENCDRVAVMYAGAIVEIAPTKELFRAPAHPYTMGLENAIPRMDEEGSAVSIPGFPPPASEWPAGCRFAPRCPYALPVCREEPPWVEVGDQHHARCHRTDERQALREASSKPESWLRVGLPA